MPNMPNMNVAVGKARISIPGNRGLKGKRRALSSLCRRTRDRFGVSIAEVGGNDAWQTATLGIACVSGSARHAAEILDSAIAYIESSREDIIVLDVEREVMGGF